MGNDNKITDVTVYDPEAASKSKSEVLLFLQEELEPLKKKKRVENYDLEKEYAKTRKNKNLSVWLTLAITFVVVVAGTWAIITKVSATNRKIEVNLESFEDLNLKNLFDALSKANELFEKASKEKAELQASLDAKLLQAKRTRDSNLEYTRKLKITKKERAAREQKIYQTYQDTVNAAHEELDEKISAADLEMKQYEEQIKSFDSENVEKAKEWEQQMDSERQLHELEKEKIQKDYEEQIANLKQTMSENQERSYNEKRAAVNDIANHYEARIAKLDPKIKDNKVNSIIQNASGLISPDSFIPESILNSVTNPDEDFNQALNNFKTRYDDLVALASVTQEIPYANGLSNLLRSEKQIAYDMSYSLAFAGATRISKLLSDNGALTSQVENLNTQIENLSLERDSFKTIVNNTTVIFDICAENEKVDGFITNCDSLENVIIYVKSSVRANVKNDGSTKVTVYGEKNKKLATGSIWFKEDVYYLSLDTTEGVELAAGNTIKVTKK